MVKCCSKQNFTCIHHEDVDVSLCAFNLSLSVWLHRKRADIWWWCEDETLKNSLPNKFSGTCAIVTLLLPVTVLKTGAGNSESVDELTSPRPIARRKRSLAGLDWGEDRTNIDSIGVPRGVPDDYNLADQVAAGFENLPIIGAFFPRHT